jgi:ribonuclease HI
MATNSEFIRIYTDGASSGNPGPGGYGIIMQYKGHEKEFSQGYRRTTNNRMELLAVIVALEKIKFPNMKVQVWSDSKYVVDAVEKGWVFSWVKKNFKDKKNSDLWKRFLEVYKKHQVRFHWLKGHADHPLNERADRLAVAAAQGDLLIDKAYEAGNA